MKYTVPCSIKTKFYINTGVNMVVSTVTENIGETHKIICFW